MPKRDLILHALFAIIIGPIIGCVSGCLVLVAFACHHSANLGDAVPQAMLMKWVAVAITVAITVGIYSSIELWKGREGGTRRAH